MSAIAALTLADGASTPVTHTFTPVNVKDGVAKWQDKVGGISVGFPTITFSLREPSKATRASKMTVKVVFPVLEVTSPSTSTGIQPAPTKAYDLMCNIEMVLPERSAQQDRKHLAAFVKNFLATSVITSAVADLEPVWG